MDAVISVLIILCCIMLVLAVLIQNPKGGGLAAGFTAGSQVMGVRRTADFLEKASWYLAIFLFVLSVYSTVRLKKAASGGNNVNETSTTKDRAGDFDNMNKGGGATANPFGGGNGGAAKPVAKPGGGK
ncbi:MAG: preprotein translocase subunit SecG [Bacteroidetes bacterium]|nr:preprotein translocase subunit SecG [Bacteroidota bacterium]